MLVEIEAVAMQNHATRVHRVKLQIGPLSGVEPQLLQQAFPIAAAGSIAERAVLDIEILPVRVRCNECGAETEAAANKLLCAKCGHWQTRLISGDEMLLASLELDTESDNRQSTTSNAVRDNLIA
jgi:hydrogenase nickel incorporation protein HypA/HybF